MMKIKPIYIVLVILVVLVIAIIYYNKKESYTTWINPYANALVSMFNSKYGTPTISVRHGVNVAHWSSSEYVDIVIVDRKVNKIGFVLKTLCDKNPPLLSKIYSYQKMNDKIKFVTFFGDDIYVVLHNIRKWLREAKQLCN